MVYSLSPNSSSFQFLVSPPASVQENQRFGAGVELYLKSIYNGASVGAAVVTPHLAVGTGSPFQLSAGGAPQPSASSVFLFVLTQPRTPELTYTVCC